MWCRSFGGLFFFFSFFWPQVLLLFWLLCCCALASFCQPSRLTRPFQTSPPALSFLAFRALLLLLHFSFLASPVFGWSHGCTFLYLRRRAFTCVGALLLSSSAPAVWAQSSRLLKMAQNDVWVDVAVEMGECWVAGKKQKNRNISLLASLHLTSVCDKYLGRRRLKDAPLLLTDIFCPTSFTMHSWLHTSPVRCTTILCWPLSRPRPLGRSWPAAVQMKRQPIKMKMSRGS